jgi:hypothetical protein
MDDSRRGKYPARGGSGKEGVDDDDIDADATGIIRGG